MVGVWIITADSHIWSFIFCIESLCNNKTLRTQSLQMFSFEIKLGDFRVV